MFLALAGVTVCGPYRYPRQRRTTVMLQAPETFLRDVPLSREFEALNEALVGYLAEVTARIFLARLHRAEQGIAARLADVKSGEHAMPVGQFAPVARQGHLG